MNENATWNDEQYAPEFSAPKSYHIVAHIKGNLIVRWVKLGALVVRHICT